MWGYRQKKVALHFKMPFSTRQEFAEKPFARHLGQRTNLGLEPNSNRASPTTNLD
jgi:hypothetical protein